MVFVHDDDLNTLRNGEPELIRPTDTIRPNYADQNESPDMIIYDEAQTPGGFARKPVMVDYRDLYEDSLRRIEEKDRVIQDLSYRVGHAESELKNSVSMIEYKKQTFLLESAKARTDEDMKLTQEEAVRLKQELIQSKFVAYLLIALVLVLMTVSAFLLLYTI